MFFCVFMGSFVVEDFFDNRKVFKKLNTYMLYNIIVVGEPDDRTRTQRMGGRVLQRRFPPWHVGL